MTGNFVIAMVVFMPFVAAVVSYGIGKIQKSARDYFAMAVTMVEVLLFVPLLLGVANGSLQASTFEWKDFCGFGLHFTMDGFRAVYGTIAAFMWMMTTLFAKEYFAHYRNRNRYYLFLLLTLGATEGVFLSSDLYTTFIFFEIMSFTSYVWVGHDEKPASLRAAQTYLAVAVIGGLVMLMGLFLLYHQIGTLEISEIYPAVSSLCGEKIPAKMYVTGALMLFGFGAKAGAFPLHIWLPKAHPVAPAPASALLSGILTKAGMFGILVITCNIFLYDTKWGTLILVLGVFTMVIGALLALFSIDLKRTLACSSVSQIGFILVGVGMQGLLGAENGLAVRGSLLHMVNHSLIKLVLFMAAGVVYMNLHSLDLNEIRGFGRKKPLLQFIFLMGALGIGGVPLWNGYISKTLIHESIVEYTELLEEGLLHPWMFGTMGMKVIEWSFLVSGGITVAYMTKLYVAIFVEKNQSAEKQASFESLAHPYMNKVSSMVLTVSAVVLPIMGFGAYRIMNGIADLGQGFMQLHKMEESIHYYSIANLKGGLTSLVIGALLYAAIVRPLLMHKEADGSRIYVNRWPKWLDLEDYFYRPVLLYLLPAIGGFLSRICDSLVDYTVVLLRKTFYRDAAIPQELYEGTTFSHMQATFMRRRDKILNKTIRIDNPRKVNYEHLYAKKSEKITENRAMITRSMSFGLLLFCLGLIITLVYLVLF